MIKISFLNQKGGVGKTTSAVNIAATMDKHFNKKVLVIDCDSQRNATQYLLGDEYNGYAISDYFNHQIPVEDIVQNVKMEKRGKMIDTNMDILASSMEISSILTENVHDILNMLKPLEKKYDYCIIDMPPQFSGISSLAENEETKGYGIALGALVASDYVIVPSMSTRFSISGYDDLINSINAIRKRGWNLNLVLLGVLFTNVNFQRGVEKYITTAGKENMAESYSNTIKSAAVIGQAEYLGKPLPYYQENNTTALEYIFLAQEIFKRVKQKEKEKKNG